MGLGTSILLLAIGLILLFAVQGDELFALGETAIDGNTIGIILIALGLLGLVLSMMARRRVVDRPVATTDRVVERDRVVEDDRLV